MRQTDYTVGAAQRKVRRRRWTLRSAIASDSHPMLQLRVLRKLEKAMVDVRKIKMRRMQIATTTFNLNAYSEHDAPTEFRFKTSDIPRIATLMSWHGEKTKRSRYRCDSITACCIVLRKLSTPCRWYDLGRLFSMRASKMSEIFWEQIECFMGAQGHLLTTFRMGLLSERAELYEAAIREKGSPLPHCVGFIDCTKIAICRPGGEGTLQRSVYSIHKRKHCLGYQTITTPDGLIFHLHGPEVSRRHDIILLRRSGIETVMEESMVIEGVQYYLYGDAAYVLRAWMQVAFPRLTATAEQEVFNTAMSALREAVQWSYKDVKQMWSSQDFKRMLKFRASPVVIFYQAAALLCNFKVCLGHGGQVASYFYCKAPSLERYISMP